MIFIDSHAHLQWEDYQETRDKIIENARKANLKYILNIGTTLETSRQSVELSRKHDDIFASVGIHPHEAKAFDKTALEALEALANDPKVIAIGETGLDFFYEHAPKEIQISAFREQIALAKALHLPISVHCRNAFANCFKLIEEINWHNGVFHCFTGTLEEATQAIALGFYVSISGIVTFKKARDLQHAVQKIPLEKMLIETDCPYLAPEPFRGKKNEPAYVTYVAQKIAELKNISLENVAETTTQNAIDLFGFKRRKT